MASRSLAVGRGAAGRRPFRGRTAIALGLATFLVVTTSVVFRRARGTAAANRLHELGSQVDELRAQRTRLDGEVRHAASRGVLVPRVQRLGLRTPSDSQVIDLANPVRR